MNYRDITLKDVSKHAKVSLMTASRALNPHSRIRVGENTRMLVRRSARELGYRPNAAARAMRNQRTEQIGVLLRNEPGRHKFNYMSAFEMVLGVNDLAEQEGYVMSVIRIEELGKGFDSRVFREKVLDGMILIGGIPGPLAQKVQTYMPKCVWLDGNHWASENCIRRDETYSGQVATQALVEAGCRRLLWIGDIPEPESHYSVAERYQAFCDVAREANVPFERLGLEAIHAQPDEAMHAELVRRVAGSISGDCKVGILAYDMPMAVRFMHYVGRADKSNQPTFALASCDEQHDVSFAWPSMGRVSVDRFDLGYHAAGMLLGRLKDPDKKYPSLKIRGQWKPGLIDW